MIVQRFLIVGLAVLLLATTACHTSKRACGDGVIRYKGNTFQLSEGDRGDYGPDTTFRDTGSDSVSMEFEHSWVVKVNDGLINLERDDTLDRRIRRVQPGGQYFFDVVWESLTPLLQRLGDGEYILPIENVVVDGDGRIIFYQSPGIQKKQLEYLRSDSPAGRYKHYAQMALPHVNNKSIIVACTLTKKGVPPLLRYRLKKNVKRLMNHTKLTALGYDGWGYWCYDFLGFRNDIVVKDHKFTIRFTMPPMNHQQRFE